MNTGIKGSRFNFSYQNRENISMFMDLGYSLSRIAQITPGGILMFFPSYRLMEQCYEHWCDNMIINEIEKSKPVFKEPKNSA
jgi:Rad3-related DNA helicase